MAIAAKYLHVLLGVGAIVCLTASSLHADETDDRIRSSADSSYIFRTYLEDDDIKLESKGGVVTLTGTVFSELHKSMAEETVKNLRGVKSVNNRLTITGTPGQADSNMWLAGRVKSSLRSYRGVNYKNTDVSAEKGKVTLRGTASSEAQKQLISEYAKDVYGVKDVDNQMTVVDDTTEVSKSLGEKIDDASITTQVKLNLLFRRGTDAFDTNVNTDDGVVTLTGTAKNQAEIDLATKRAADVRGVKSVRNEMVIETKKVSSN